jgi:glycosyltransferase involved in cell wall biosynthesis
VSKRIAFYAPLKAPTHPVPSGDRRVARLLTQALELAGYQVELASTLRSFEGLGDPARQQQIQVQGQQEALEIIQAWQSRPPSERPRLWFTYHLYYKAPDWIGPAVCAALRMPYVLCEASHAPKRAAGPWRSGHEAVGQAIAGADLVLAPTQDDLACIEAAAGARTRIERLPPFLDAAPFALARETGVDARRAMAASYGLDPGAPWLLAVGMMRRGDKLASYLALARALGLITDIPWQLLVVGDGPARQEVQSAIEAAAPSRARFLGERAGEGMPVVYACADLCVWPAVNEAYGMALLEAQATGLPVVAGKARGVPEVVCDGETGWLTPVGDTAAFAHAIRTLLKDPARRRRMGQAASGFVRDQRSLAQASGRLSALLQETLQRRGLAVPVGSAA